MNEYPPSAGESAAPAKCRLLIAGATLAEAVRGPEGFGNYAEVVHEFPDLDTWLKAEAGGDSLDLVLLHAPSLFPETVDAIRDRLAAMGLSRAIVVYEFAKQSTRSMIEAETGSITALRAPVTPRELKLACEADIALASLRADWSQSPLTPEASDAAETSGGGLLAAAGEIPQRMFSDDALARIKDISTAIDCECPHHLSTLLNSLNAFELYSKECENRNDEDALLHAYLHRTTAKARSIMEEALSVLAEAEGLDTA